MEITFVGTAHGIPEKDRRCSSTMLETGGNLYLIDMGCMAVEDIRRTGKQVASVKGVFLTHMHGDHVNGLPSFVDLCSWYFTSADPVILLPTEQGCEALKTWIRALDTQERDLRISSYGGFAPGVIFDDGVLKVTAFKTQHTVSSHAFLCEAEGKHVLFTGDLKHPSVDFPPELFGTKMDLAVCETAHFPPEDYLPVWKKMEIDTVVLQHVQPRKEPLAEDLAKRQTISPRIVVGYDMMRMTL